MPNRIIKETINESRALNDCSVFAQDLFKRLITYADDNGRFNADTQIMLARLYPRDLDIVSQEDIVNGLIELCGIGKIQFYTSTMFSNRGAKDVYGVFPNWNTHQRVRDSKEKHPAPDDTEINDWYLRRFISIDMKAEIIERDGFKCQICGKFLTTCKDAKRFVKLATGLYHIDHIVPVNQGGRATLENLRLTCPDCNLKRKRKFTFDEILAETRRELPQAAASCGLNPIQSNPNTNPNPEPESEPARGGGDVRPDFNTVEVYAANNLAALNAGNMQEFIAFKDELPEELIRHAIDEACAAGKRTWSYTRAILTRYRDSGFKTVGEARAAKPPVKSVAASAPVKRNYQERAATDDTYGKNSYSDPTKDLE